MSTGGTPSAQRQRLTNMPPEEWLAVGRLRAKKDAPYLSAAINALVPREASGKKTIGVSYRGVLFYDPVTIVTWTADELGGALQHEAWHILRDHHTRGEQLSASLLLWNFACDMAINDDLKNANIGLPCGTPDRWTGKTYGLLPERAGYKDGETEEVYYAKLRQQFPEPETARVTLRIGPAEAANGQCGSAAGVPGEEEASGSAEGDKAGAEGRTPTELAQIRVQVAQDILEHARSRGNLPAEMQRWAGDQLRPPIIDWRTKLARAIRRSVAFRPGMQDFHYSRPSRRQAGLGYGYGKPVLPAMRSPVPEVLVVVDTSGSMQEEEHAQAIAEIAGILKATSTSVNFIAIDAAVHVVKRLKSWTDARESFIGGGGTDFRPAFDAVAAMRVKPDLMVFITDGCGPAPERPPHGTHVIWLLVGDYAASPCDWGEQIRTSPDGQARQLRKR